MREQYEKRLYDFVNVSGEIAEFRFMKFDGYKRIMEKNPKDGFIYPVRFTDGGLREPVYFTGRTTLVLNARAEGELIGDGHIWISEDLEKKGFRIGDKITICGNVEAYKKGNGKYDYCVFPKRIERREKRR